MSIGVAPGGGQATSVSAGDGESDERAPLAWRVHSPPSPSVREWTETARTPMDGFTFVTYDRA